jgi:hypothetical protein
MIADQTVPTQGAKPIKRLLRVLKEIHADWQEKHPGSYMEVPTSLRMLCEELK